MPTREECLRELAQAIADSRALQATRTPREAAQAAWFPGHRWTVDRLEDEIRADRGLPPIDRSDTQTGAA